MHFSQERLKFFNVFKKLSRTVIVSFEKRVYSITSIVNDFDNRTEKKVNKGCKDIGTLTGIIARRYERRVAPVRYGWVNPRLSERRLLETH